MLTRAHSARVQGRKGSGGGGGGGGNRTMKMAGKLVMSKRGLAIAERGDESDEEQLERYKHVFGQPLSPEQIEALTALAKARDAGASQGLASGLSIL